MLSSEAESALVAGLNLLKTVLPVDAFFGRRNRRTESIGISSSPQNASVVGHRVKKSKTENFVKVSWYKEKAFDRKISRMILSHSLWSW